MVGYNNTNMEKLPFVTALIVMRNEHNYIERSLMSFVNQTYPKDNYEIIVVDGGSDDGSLDIVNNIIQKYSTERFHISILDNPKRILAAGWNLGIKAAKGEYVTRIDAHAVADPDFIEKSVEVMMRTKASCVGGKLTSISEDGTDNIVSKILSSPLGVGNSSFRVSNSEGVVDTAVYGLYKKDLFERIGYFDESMVRSQDLEMHGRIRRDGGIFYFSPVIHSTYYTRNTIKKMLKQAYGNGKWNMVLIKRGVSGLSLRHLVPFIFVLYFLLSVAGGFVYHWIWWLCLGVLFLHLMLGVIFSIKKSAKVKEILAMPFLFMALHFAYGLGYFSGLLIK